MTINLKKLAEDFERAMLDHRASFGVGPMPTLKKRTALQILMWDHRKDIMRALKIAAQHEKSSS